MKIGHEFHPEHGFTGSANPSTDMRPEMPGFKRGGMDKKMKHKEHGDHPKNEHHGHEDEHGFHIHKGHKGKKHMKMGGKAEMHEDED